MDHGRIVVAAVVHVVYSFLVTRINATSACTYGIRRASCINITRQNEVSLQSLRNYTAGSAGGAGEMDCITDDLALGFIGQEEGVHCRRRIQLVLHGM